MAGGAGLGDQPVAGIGDERRAGVADQRHRLALGERRQQLRPLPRRVVLVIGDERRLDAVVAQQHRRHPRVLAGDEVGGGERRQRAQR